MAPPYIAKRRVWWGGSEFLVNGVPASPGDVSEDTLALLRPIPVPSSFHVSPSTFRDSIRSQGLTPSKPKRVGNEKGVYLFADLCDADEAVKHYGGDIWAVNTDGITLYQDCLVRHLRAVVSRAHIAAIA